MTIQVTRPSMPGYEEYCEEIRELWDTRWLTNCGSKHQEFEKQLKQYLDANNLELFCNGHMALETVLSGMNLSGEVITTPFTFASTTQAIIRCGLTPVFCDINEDDYTIDVEKIEELITERTSAIVPVQVYGHICNYKAIDEIAKKHDLKVIYDAAHAFGETVDGINVAKLGDASMFSFHATKVFHSVEGGAVTFKDFALSTKLAALRNFGITDIDTYEYVGYNAKMSEFHAAMGICNLRHIDDAISRRKMLRERYYEQLVGIEGIKLPKIQDNVVSNNAYFPVVFDDITFGKTRDQVLNDLAKESVHARKYFFPLTYNLAGKSDNLVANCPVAKDISEKILTLPLYEELELDEIEGICIAITNKEL